jgi:hypothetical protein
VILMLYSRLLIALIISSCAFVSANAANGSSTYVVEGDKIRYMTGGFVYAEEYLTAERKAALRGSEKSTLIADDKGRTAEDGGGIAPQQFNTLVDRYNRCRWLDNFDNSNNYFVPTGREDNWIAFTNNLPSNVEAAPCCPVKAVTLIAGDGKTYATALPVGREADTTSLGTRTISNTFTVAGGTQTVSEIYRCTGGQWIGSGQIATAMPTAPPLIPIVASLPEPEPEPWSPPTVPAVPAWVGPTTPVYEPPVIVVTPEPPPVVVVPPVIIVEPTPPVIPPIVVVETTPTPTPPLGRVLDTCGERLGWGECGRK